ncbi:hypothetical protein SNE40_010356 [Patella caerulea]|uniref:Endonuclease/exonuclease/phosphatase domain-containing protein n=1 Tax=Patella caerulea TaxID=87958 RepID=A0AAN8PRI6_PATCE
MERDLYLCAAYIPPEGSPHSDDDFQTLQASVNELNDAGDILLMGDLNAKVGNFKDYIPFDDCKHIDQYLSDNYVSDQTINRKSESKTVNNHGKQLIDICTSSELRILNGRFIGDLLGNPFCFQYNERVQHNS